MGNARLLRLVTVHRLLRLDLSTTQNTGVHMSYSLLRFHCRRTMG